METKGGPGGAAAFLGWVPPFKSISPLSGDSRGGPNTNQNPKDKNPKLTEPSSPAALSALAGASLWLEGGVGRIPPSSVADVGLPGWPGARCPSHAEWKCPMELW